MPLPLVVWNHKDLFYPYLPAGSVYSPYTRKWPYTFPNRVLWKLRLRRPFEYPQWIRTLRRGEKVLFLDGGLVDPGYLKLLLPYREQMIVFMWNMVSANQQFIIDQRDKLNIYSHDRSDCQRYGLKFNSTFYCRPPEGSIVPADKAHDIVFIGAAKNRMASIAAFHQKLRPFDRLFHIFCPTATMEATQKEAGELKLHTQFMPYATYLGHIVRCKAIHEIMQHGQDSLTLRVMESLFFRKKLITTYQNIVNEDFYNPANIMVVSHPDELEESRVRQFIESDYVDVDPQIVQSYEYQNWIRRFE